MAIAVLAAIAFSTLVAGIAVFSNTANASLTIVEAGKHGSGFESQNGIRIGILGKLWKT